MRLRPRPRAGSQSPARRQAKGWVKDDTGAQGKVAGAGSASGADGPDGSHGDTAAAAGAAVGAVTAANTPAARLTQARYHQVDKGF